MSFLESASPLFSLKRSGVVELSCFGYIAVCDHSTSIFQVGEVLPKIPMRSLTKPFQFQATGLEEVEWRGFEGPFVAATGSLSANEMQVKRLREWYEGKNFLSLLKRVKLPATFPLDDGNRGRLIKDQLPKEPLLNNCFSKHTAIVRACDLNGWDAKSYLQQDHPYHLRLDRILSEALGVPEGTIFYAVDGCLLPSPVLALNQMARLYQRIATANANTFLGKIRDHMMEFPDWIGGPGRMDSEFMRANPGKVLAKEGADGLLGVAIQPTSEFPNGLGIVIKLASGYQPFFAMLAIDPILHRLGLKGVANVPEGQTVEHHYQPLKPTVKKFWDLSPLLNKELAVWPGDVSLQRTLSKDMSKGENYTLSSIQTTLHLGAHTDAPNHFENSRTGIAEVDLNKYFGACQVISISRPPHSRIEWEHVQNIEIRAPRLLFKTASFRGGREFQRDFVALSPSLVREAHARGVFLLGIDTPSIDPFDCEDLPTHLETLKTGTAILEGIDLREVDDGIYHLMALPLRLEGMDASPVRAILTR